jgi:GDP-mannose 4,6-dehydratase|tara:strand:- start:272 stop:1234 length:963 start_codon:yes stop_codon:yes gene_type:complete
MKSRNFKRCLITGITGSGGSFLTEHVLKQNKKIKIFGLYRSSGYKKLLEKNYKKNICFYKIDLNNFNSLKKIIKKIKPDLIYNFASNPDVRMSFELPRETINNNYQSTLNLFESVRVLKLKSLIIHCGTSEVYGSVSKKDVPIKETLGIRPVSPYAVSKAYQDLCAQLYSKIYNLNIIITRMFTYINPRRNNLFQSAFASQIIKMKTKKDKILKHGNLKSIRTSLSLNDAMNAYWLVAKKGKIGEIYNIGGTKKYSVGEILDKLISISGIKVKKKIDKKLLRLKDVTLQLPNIKKFKLDTGWTQKEKLDMSLRKLLKELK